MVQGETISIIFLGEFNISKIKQVVAHIKPSQANVYNVYLRFHNKWLLILDLSRTYYKFEKCKIISASEVFRTLHNAITGLISDPVIANGVVSLIMSLSITVGSGYVRLVLVKLYYFIIREAIVLTPSCHGITKEIDLLTFVFNDCFYITSSDR